MYSKADGLFRAVGSFLGGEPLSEHKKEKKAAVTTAVAAATAASLLVGGLFDTPRDLLEGDGSSPSPVMLDAADLDDGLDEDLEEESGQDGEERKRGGLRSVLRSRVLRLPLAARMLLVLPAWGVGSLFLLGGDALLTALSPLLGKVLGVVLLAAALVGAFLLAAKTIFPDLPLKKILNRRTLPALLMGAGVLAALDGILSVTWADYGDWKSVVQSVGLLAALTGTVCAFVIREQKARRKAKMAASTEKAPKELIFTDAAGSFTIPIKWPRD